MYADYVVVVVVKAWNIQTASEFTLDGPKGRVLAMVVGNDTLFAAAEVTTCSGLQLLSSVIRLMFFHR